MTADILVTKLPDGAEADYPYTVGQVKSELTMFWFNVKTNKGGDLGFTMHIQEKVRKVLANRGGKWVLVVEKKQIDIGMAEVTIDEIVSQEVDQDPDTGETVNTVNVKLTPTKVKVDEPLLSTTKGIEKLKKNQPVEHVIQWREAKELKQ